MTTRPLPKTLRDACAMFSDRAGEGWSELDGFFGDRIWGHWIELRPGWRNAWVDPFAPLHTIHESTTRECLVQLRKAQPCDCDECKRALLQELIKEVEQVPELTPLAKALHDQVWPLLSANDRAACKNVGEENAMMNKWTPVLAGLIVDTPAQILANVWGVSVDEARGRRAGVSAALWVAHDHADDADRIRQAFEDQLTVEEDEPGDRPASEVLGGP